MPATKKKKRNGSGCESNGGILSSGPRQIWLGEKNGWWGWRSEPLAHLQGLESRRCDVWQPGSAARWGGSKWTPPPTTTAHRRCHLHHSLLFISRNKMCPLTSHISARLIAGKVGYGARAREGGDGRGALHKCIPQCFFESNFTLRKGTQQMAYK